MPIYNDSIVGTVWAPGGEAGHWRRRTVAAWLPAHQGAALLLQEADGALHWELSATFEGWARANDAKRVVARDPDADTLEALLATE